MKPGAACSQPEMSPISRGLKMEAQDNYQQLPLEDMSQLVVHY